MAAVESMQVDQRVLETADERVRTLFPIVFEHALHYATRFTDYDTACDIAQTVAIDLASRRPEILRSAQDDSAQNDSAPAPDDNYLYQAVRRQFAFVARTRHRREMYEGAARSELAVEQSWMNPAVAQEEKELVHAAERALADMPPRQRAVYLKVRDEGKRYKDVASEMGLSVKTVQAHVVHAQVLLRRALTRFDVSA